MLSEYPAARLPVFGGWSVEHIGQGDLPQGVPLEKEQDGGAQLVIKAVGLLRLQAGDIVEQILAGIPAPVVSGHSGGVCLQYRLPAVPHLEVYRWVMVTSRVLMLSRPLALSW